MAKNDNTSLMTISGWKGLFTIDHNPRKGLLLFEKVVLGYTILTTLLIFFLYTKLSNPVEMLIARVRFMAIMLALWGVYRMVPCRLLLGLRGFVQLAMLGIWYPETYEFNKLFPNLDYLFAGWEQELFGCQPALLFSSSCLA